MPNLMHTLDVINGLYEAGGSLAVLNNCRHALKDKQIKGISYGSTIYFTSWGFFNTIFYSNLVQWMSFTGGLAMVAANIWYVYLILKYRKN